MPTANARHLETDNAPGSYVNSIGLLQKQFSAYNISISDAGRYYSFIPVISALDINTNNYFSHIYQQSNGDIASMTPFDEVYYPPNNQLHLSMSEEFSKQLIQSINTRHDLAWQVSAIGHLLF